MVINVQRNTTTHILTRLLRYFYLICVALLFAACTTDNSDLTSSPLMSVEYSNIPVAFAANDDDRQETLTRGTQTTAASLQSFAVNAQYYTAASQYGRDFFDAQKITKATDKWTYDPVKYWPTTGTIDFYAYSPTQDQIKGTFESINMLHNEAYVWLMHYSVKAPVITSITELSGNTITAASFAKAIDAQNQQDLLLATNVDNVCSDERGINSKVQFNFKHALAGLNFKFDAAAAIPTGADYVILSIAPMCAGGTIAMNATNNITWTTDESEATYYQAYKIESSQLKDYQAKTFFLPPQKLKNFTVTARFYKDNGDDTYTHLVTRYSNHLAIELKQGVTTTINLTP